MKKTACLLLVFAIHFYVFSQTKNFIDQPYLETKATYTQTVSPDRIYLSITINEKDTKGKIAVEVLENKMYNSLKNLGIDTDKQLKLSDLTSNFRKAFLKKTDILKNKIYTLVVYDAQTASNVILKLEELNIANVSLNRVEYSKLEELKLKLKGNAIEKAKRQAEELLKPLNQKLGNALYISDTGFSASNILRGKASGVNSIQAYDRQAFAPTDIEFEKIRVQSSVTVFFAIE